MSARPSSHPARRGPAGAPLATVDLAIVGGGSVAVSFLHQFLHALARPAPGLSIALFEPQPVVGPGTAYQHDLCSNLLNIPAGRMSALARERDDFVQWLHGQDGPWLRRMGVQEISASAFLPRPVFGCYLQDVHRRALARAQAMGVAVRVIGQAAVAVRPAPQGATVATAGGEPVHARRVVLCNGNLPSVAFAELAHLPGYFNSPYPVQALTAAVGRDDPVCILGTSLSAVDAIVALHASGHRGSIHCVSRNGRLPSVRSPHNPSVCLPQWPPAQAQGEPTLDGLLQSLRQALRQAGGIEEPDDVLGKAGPAREALDDEIARSQAGPRLWQAVAAATNDRIEIIWRALPRHEKERFHRDWRSLWMARRATFPMQNALVLQKLLHQGRLQVRGGLRAVRHEPASGRFVLRTASGDAAAAPWLVNATSFSTDVRATRDALVRQLLDERYAAADELGGFALDFDTGCLLAPDGDRQAAVSVLGSLAAGTYFWTTSMDVNARLALGQAERLAAELAPHAAARQTPSALQAPA
ncbi:FAD/NAD(P)-binding protein [Orrella sp. JC864]|uniref:FAD/NAD(P)-binding protein n=1 Tax=Orrella sp. JC864 TaxID=3120298 RepID=UPI003009B759